MSQGGIIQLLPETRRSVDISVPGENKPLYWGAGVLVLVVVLFAGLKIYSSILTKKLTTINNEALALEQKRDRDFEKELLVLDQRFFSASGLLTNHIIWSNALVKIQGLTHPQIQIDTFLADTQDGKIDVKGFASSYTTIAKFVASLLSEEAIADVTLNKIDNKPTGLLEFNMGILFNKNEFLLNKK